MSEIKRLWKSIRARVNRREDFDYEVTTHTPTGTELADEFRRVNLWPASLDMESMAGELRESMGGIREATEGAYRDLSGKLGGVWNSLHQLVDTVSSRCDGLMRQFDDPKWEKEDALRSIIHDMKQPVSVIKLEAIALRDHGERLSDDDRKSYLESINDKCDELAWQIDTLLDIDPRREMKLIVSEFDLVDLARKVIGPYQRTALRLQRDGAAHHAYEIEFAICPLLLRADRAKINRVLCNLVSNAAKYSPNKGTIRTTLADEGDLVLASVSDQGIGIAPDKLEIVFDPFVRVADDEHPIPGAGIGLFSAKRLVDAHGGRIWVESQPGVGTTFSFTLPRNN
jgi:signal transduction histidine kinase